MGEKMSDSEILRDLEAAMREGDEEGRKAPLYGMPTFDAQAKEVQRLVGQDAEAARKIADELEGMADMAADHAKALAPKGMPKQAAQAIRETVDQLQRPKKPWYRRLFS